MNQLRQAVDNDDNLYVLDNCLEDVLGYPPPSYEKPYKAYEQTLNWGESYEGIPEKWRKLYESLMDIEV